MVSQISCEIVKYGKQFGTMSRTHFPGRNDKSNGSNRKIDERRDKSDGMTNTMAAVASSSKQMVVKISAKRSSKVKPNDDSSNAIGIPHKVYISELFKCLRCSSDYLLGKYLAKHATMYHNDIPADQDIFEMISMVKLVECVLCGLKLPNIERLVKHTNRAHQMKIEAVKQVADVAVNAHDSEFADVNQNESAFEDQNKPCDTVAAATQHRLFEKVKDNGTLDDRYHVKNDRNMNDNEMVGHESKPKVKFNLSTKKKSTKLFQR